MPVPEALGVANELKNQALTAQTLNFQGDRFFYRGDFKNARALYERAQQASAKLTDSHIVLLSKLNLAKVAVKEGRSRWMNGLVVECSRTVWTWVRASRMLCR